MLRFQSDAKAQAFVDFWAKEKPALKMTRAGATVAVEGCDPRQIENVWAVMIEEASRRQPDVYKVPTVRDLAGSSTDRRAAGWKTFMPLTRWYPRSWPFYEPAEFARRWADQDWQRT